MIVVCLLYLAFFCLMRSCYACYVFLSLTHTHTLSFSLTHTHAFWNPLGAFSQRQVVLIHPALALKFPNGDKGAGHNSSNTHVLTHIHIYRVTQQPLLQRLSLVSHWRHITLKFSYWVPFFLCLLPVAFCKPNKLEDCLSRLLSDFLGWLKVCGLEVTTSPSPPTEVTQSTFPKPGLGKVPY